jgi:hypothetical protein
MGDNPREALTLLSGVAARHRGGTGVAGWELGQRGRRGP